VEGIVQIVDEKNINAFRKGNILVCATTTVDYLPAVRNAKAIITNDGGIMSHPSIISRELNIPAIVGTKYATSKLKNGMRVRMDFSAGTIEIENGKLKS